MFTLRPRLDGIALRENLHQELDQLACAGAIGVEPRVVDSELHPERARMARERSEERGQLVDAGPARRRRVHRRHDAGVENVGVDVDPEACEVGARDPCLYLRRDGARASLTERSTWKIQHERAGPLGLDPAISPGRPRTA